jgi:hypothetical protein
MGGNRVGMRYDIHVTLDKRGKLKQSRTKQLKQQNKLLAREVLELRAELAIVKRIAVYSINLRNEGITIGESHGN